MLTMKKSLLYTLFAMIILMSVFVFMGVTTNVSVYADSTKYLSDEKYTESDVLVNDDGSESNKNIQTFSNEVKAANSGTSFPELAQVIPRQYLETAEANATYSYNGKEYGFYMVKEGDYFDLLLIDFVYEFEDKTPSDLEYKIKIKPLLQQSFLRSTENGSFVWKKYDGARYSYYVSNPRFLTALQNENALNYGDKGYSKYYDDGLIIAQSRANYGKISYATEADFDRILAEFTANQLFNFGCAILDELTFSAGGKILGLIKDSVELGMDFYEQGKEQTILTDNEVNINTKMSKTAQRDNVNLDGYSRVVGFAPIEEIVLSEANNSYAEFITVLNDTNYKSRLTQICEFDIVKRDSQFSSMEYVTGSANNSAFAFCKERILFDDKYPHFNIPANDFENSTVPLYLLPYGNQQVTFTPDYSGTYNFNLYENLALSFAENIDVASQGNLYSAYLTGETAYHILIKNKTANRYVGSQLTCALKGFDTATLSIKANEKYIVSYVPNVDGVKKIASGNSLVSVSVLNSNLLYLKRTTTGECYYNFEAGERYYILFENTTSNNAVISMTQANPATASVNNKESASLNNSEVYYKYSLASGQYIFEYKTSNGVHYRECSSEVTYGHITSNNRNASYFIVDITNAQEVSFGFSGTGSLEFIMYPYKSAEHWEINGKVLSKDIELPNVSYVNNSEIAVRRGSSVSVRLKLGDEYIDDLVYRAGNTNNWSYNNYTVTIQSACSLTNIKGENKLILQVAIDRHIISLYISVLSDIEKINFDFYSNQNEYGIQYSKISNINTDRAEIEYIIDYPDATNDYSGIHNGSFAAGNINIRNIVDTNYSSLVNFKIIIKKISIVNNSGKATIYDKNDSSKQYISITSEFEGNMYFGKGDGSYEKPYLISNSRNLYNLRYGVAAVSDNYIYGYYELTNDITLEGSWTPIPKPFAGTLEGNYYTIIGLKINVDKNAGYGLFGSLKNGKVSRLNFSNVSINASTIISDTVNVGIVAGANNGGTIESCEIISGKVTVGNAPNILIGGIVGFNMVYGNINNCTNRAEICGNGTIGGIAGFNQGQINGSRNYGTVKGPNILGGIAGMNYQGVISYCVNRGEVQCESGGIPNAGGIAGKQGSGAKIEGTVNYGKIAYVGGATSDKNFQPRIGQVVGLNGSGCKYDIAFTGIKANSGTVDKGALTQVGGFIGIGKTDQAKYVSSEYVGEQL